MRTSSFRFGVKEVKMFGIGEKLLKFCSLVCSSIMASPGDKIGQRRGSCGHIMALLTPANKGWGYTRPLRRPGSRRWA